MTQLDDLTKEVVEELRELGESYDVTIQSWCNSSPLLAANFASVVLANDIGLGLICALDPSVTAKIQALMYLSYKVGEKKGRGDMLEELCGGRLEF